MPQEEQQWWLQLFQQLCDPPPLQTDSVVPVYCPYLQMAAAKTVYLSYISKNSYYKYKD
jgi:hypothetical protein